jgi:hypothetical protein
MTGGTLYRASSAVFMAILTVGVKCIRSRGITFRPVTVLSVTGHRVILFFVVTVIAGHAISFVYRMGHVIKEHLACRSLKHNPHRLLRGFL